MPMWTALRLLPLPQVGPFRVNCMHFRSMKVRWTSRLRISHGCDAACGRDRAGGRERMGEYEAAFSAQENPKAELRGVRKI